MKRGMGKIALAAMFVPALAGAAAAKEVTVTTSILACVSGEAYGKFSRDVQETGDERQAVATAVLSHDCRLFSAGTIFVIEKTQGPVLVLIRVKGGRELFWTSRLLLR